MPIHLNLSSLPWNAISIDMMTAGSMAITAGGYMHTKTVPHSIIAQATLGRYEIHTGDGRSADLASGEAFLTGANIPLRIVHHGDPHRKDHMQSRWLHFHFTLFQAIDITSLLDMPLRIDQRACSPFAEIIEELLLPVDPSSQGLNTTARRHELAFKVLRLLAELAPMKANSLAFLQQGERLRPVLSHVLNHLAEPLDVASLARLAHLSIPRFHVFFRQWMGRTPMEHIRNLRLSEACRRLITTHAPLRTIAEDTGFCSPFHLSREFKTAFGEPPDTYRRRYNRNLV